MDDPTPASGEGNEPVEGWVPPLDADRDQIGIASLGAAIREGNVEATTGVEPVNSGFADRRVRPLRHVAAVVRRSGYGGCWLPLEDSNLGSRIQSPLSYH